MRNTAILTIALILAAFIPGNASCEKTIKGYKNVLSPYFALEDQVDPDREVFAGVLDKCSGGDSLICRAELVRSILSEGRLGRFDPWPPRIDALHRAEKFLKNEYILGIHKKYKLRENLSWNESPAGSNNWEFNLHALEILSNATEAYRRTGERKYLEKCRDLISDFIDDNFDHRYLPSRYSWYDHSVSNRTIHAIDFWHEWLGLEDPDLDFVDDFLEFIWRLSW